MKKVFVLILLAIPIFLQAQTEDNLIGNWYDYKTDMPSIQRLTLFSDNTYKLKDLLKGTSIGKWGIRGDSLFLRSSNDYTYWYDIDNDYTELVLTYIITNFKEKIKIRNTLLEYGNPIFRKE